MSAKAVRADSMDVVVKLLFIFVSYPIEASAVAYPAAAEVAKLYLLLGLFGKGEILGLMALIRLVGLVAHGVFRGKKRASLELLMLILSIDVVRNACFALFLVSTLNAIQSKSAQLL